MPGYRAGGWATIRRPQTIGSRLWGKTGLWLWNHQAHFTQTTQSVCPFRTSGYRPLWFCFTGSAFPHGLPRALYEAYQIRQANNIEATDLVLFAETDLQSDKFTLLKGIEEFAFADGVKVGNSKAFAIRDESIPMTDLKLKIADTQAELKKVWMVLRFVLK